MLDFPGYLAAARRNFFHQDPTFKEALFSSLSEDWRDWTEERCDSVGELAATTWADLAETANAHPPTLVPRNAWGDRIDRIDVHPAYDRLAQEAYEAGVVWPRFNARLDGKKAPWGVVFGLGYLFGQAEQGMFCPVCLTAGTAWLIERFADEDLKRRYLPRVAAKSYDKLLEGAMFLTEREGGSDVGASVVEARHEDGEWRLYGDKWFCSNMGRAGVMMVLARPQGAPAGTKGLGLFLVPRELDNGSRNAYEIHRLKDKLGTRSMPSGEVTFTGAVGYPVGDVTRGFYAMVEMLTLSRIYNAVASVGNMKRVLNEVLAYSRHRVAFGSTIENYPMVRAQLAAQTIEQEACMRGTFETIRLLDKVEGGVAGPRDQKVLRLLTPINKYFTARVAVDMASWGAEAIGGNGYIEDWPIARFFRDGQVLPIWEGTTNILVLDAIRSFMKENTAPAYLAEIGARLSAAFPAAFAPWREALGRQVADLEQHLEALSQLAEADYTVHAKAWCDRALRVFQAVLLLEAAARGLEQDNGRGVLVMDQFMRRHFAPQSWKDVLAGRTAAADYAEIVGHEPISAHEAIERVRAGLPVSSL